MTEILFDMKYACQRPLPGALMNNACRWPLIEALIVLAALAGSSYALWLLEAPTRSFDTLFLLMG
jgi:hypothetical protein